MINAFTSIARLIPLVVVAVQSIERFCTDRKGKDKQDAAIDMVRTLIPVLEGYVGRDVLDDQHVERLLRAAIDAIVALQNAIDAARKLRAQPGEAP